ncbi:MAG: hypothetical protein ACTHM6_01520 [Tepidisphaeraceae bacterium]
MPDYWTTPLTLIAILIASSIMVARLIRRHTTGMDRFSKWEWCVNRGFRRGRIGSVVRIDALDEIRSHALRAVEHYVSRDQHTSIYRLQSVSPEGTVQTWNALIRTVDHYSTPIALRPVHVPANLVDLMQLQLFPKLSSEARFNVYGLRAIDARLLATGPSKALLPYDIGLIRNADAVILDFTTRPFDPVEFSRMCAIAEQIVAGLKQ